MITLCKTWIRDQYLSYSGGDPILVERTTESRSGSDEYVYDPMKPLIPYPSELLIFQFAVFVSSHFMQRG